VLKMRIKLAPTKSVHVLGFDKRSADNLVWCAMSYGVSRTFWANGYLFCVEVYEKAFEYEVEKEVFPISQVCYTPYPKYSKVYEIRGAQMPIVDVSEMNLYRTLVSMMKAHERRSGRAARPRC